MYVSIPLHTYGHMYIKGAKKVRPGTGHKGEEGGGDKGIALLFLQSRG
jgi:hypothetical protein